MSHSQMEEELTCPICMELFCQPRRLPCGHSYCHKCIASMLSKSAEESRSYLSFSRPLICPECRDVINLDFVEGIEAIPLDFKLSKLVELFQFIKKSDDSDSDGATSSKNRLKSAKAAPVADHHWKTTGNLPPSASHDSLSLSSPGNQENSHTKTSDEPSSSATLIRVSAASAEAVIGDHSDGSSSQATTSGQSGAANKIFSAAQKRDDSFVNQRYLPETVHATSAAYFERKGEGSSHRSSHASDDEACLGAVGGVPLKEIPVTDSTRRGSSASLRGSFQHGMVATVNTNDSRVNTDTGSEREIQYVASAFSPSIATTVPQPHCLLHSLENSASSHSYAEFPSSNQPRVQKQGRFIRAQSLPSDVANTAAGLGEGGKRSDSKRRQKVKKKKRRGWPTLFRDDSSSSSSDESCCSGNSEQAESHPQPPTSQVKKGRLVTRFLKSIIFSDSSSSDWSDGSDKETEGGKIQKRGHLQRTGPSEPSQRPVVSVSSQSETQLSNVEAFPGNASVGHQATNRDSHLDTHSNGFPSRHHSQNLQPGGTYVSTDNKGSESLDGNSLVHSDSNTRLKDTVESSKAAAKSEVQETEMCQAECAITCPDSKTQPKQILPTDDSLSPVKSCQQASASGPKNTFASIDSNTQVKLKTSSTGLIPESANISNPSAEAGERDSHLVKRRSDKKISKPNCESVAAEEASIRPLSLSDRGSPFAPSHYDNFPNNDSMPIGMSELDLEVSSHEPVNAPRSPLPVGGTFYDNVNSPGLPSKARTLYDNISDSDLVNCRLEAEAALRQRHSRHNPSAEIEDLKTGFENIQGSNTATLAGRSNADNGLSFQEEFLSIDRQPHSVDSSALMQEVSPQMLSPRPTAGPFEIADLKNDFTDYRAAQPQGMENHIQIAADPSPKASPLHLKSNLMQPSSLYDNVGRSTLVPDQPTANEERFGAPSQDAAGLCLDGSSSAGAMFGGSPGEAVNQSQVDDSVHGSTSGALTANSRDLVASPQDRNNDNNNNVDTNERRNYFEEEDDINDEETDPGARMLQPKRKPRSKLRKFITSLLSLSSSSDDDEPYYTNNTSSSSKSSDW